MDVPYIYYSIDIKHRYFLYLVICIVCIAMQKKVKTSTVLSGVVLIWGIFQIEQVLKRQTVREKEKVEDKMRQIGSTRYFYLNPNLILIFYQILPWKKLHTTAYDKALHCCDDIMYTYFRIFCSNSYTLKQTSAEVKDLYSFAFGKLTEALDSIKAFSLVSSTNILKDIVKTAQIEVYNNLNPILDSIQKHGRSLEASLPISSQTAHP